jgi:Histidine kinase-, DNA gyrase B-, and HSP90-like ATPase
MHIKVTKGKRFYVIYHMQTMNTLIDISGTTEIGDEGIKKHFKNIEPWQPFFELTWNGFDAGANLVALTFRENQLQGTDAVTILDNGVGIDHRKLKETFGKFNESAKLEDATQHGANGRGRLAFHRICNLATWHTRSTSGDARIVIDASKIKVYDGKALPSGNQCAELRKVPSGTFVELQKFTVNLPSSVELCEKFSVEFGWFLAMHPGKSLSLNGTVIAVPKNENTRKQIAIGGHAFDVQVIRWNERPSSEKSFTYLLNSRGLLVYKQLSTLNNKPGFFTSICVTSEWANTFSAEQDIFHPNAHTLNSSEWKRLSRELNELTDSIYENFLRKQAEREIERYVEDGYFPSYAGLPPDERAWRLNNAKELVREIYVADPTVFNTANKKQRKIIIRLLDRLAVSNENDSLFEVLNSVLELDDKSVAKLAQQLKQTTLENIVATIEVLQRRQTGASQLRTLMNDHYREVLETPDLQKIIENNTWLFGPGYETLGAEEDTFTKIAKRLRDTIPQVDKVDSTDLDDPADIDGANRQTDLFLARRIPTVESDGQKIFRCVIIEIKRPSLSLNKKHLRQLDDYADIIKRHPEFSSTKMRFELILVGRQILRTLRFLADSTAS